MDRQPFFEFAILTRATISAFEPSTGKSLYATAAICLIILSASAGSNHQGE
jgi:hypothetical protein